MQVHHTEGKFFVELEGEEAVLLYRKHDSALDLYHTFTPEKLRGKGIAEKLTLAAFEYADTHKMKIIPTCPYIRDKFLADHKEWKRLIA